MTLRIPNDSFEYVYNSTHKESMDLHFTFMRQLLLPDIQILQRTVFYCVIVNRLLSLLPQKYI